MRFKTRVEMKCGIWYLKIYDNDKYRTRMTWNKDETWIWIQPEVNTIFLKESLFPKPQKQVLSHFGPLRDALVALLKSGGLLFKESRLWSHNDMFDQMASVKDPPWQPPFKALTEIAEKSRSFFLPMCPHAAICLSSYCYVCPHTAIPYTAIYCTTRIFGA